MARRVRFWDLAATAHETADYSVGCRMARETILEGGAVVETERGRAVTRPVYRYFIEDVVRGRWTPHDRDAVVLQTAQLDGRATEIVIEQEPGSGGLAQIAALVQLLAGYRVSGRRSTGDKVTRAGPLASQMEAGNVKLIEGAWVASFIDELTAFPTVGVHDDQVDAAASAFLVLTEVAVNPLAGLLGHGAAKSGWTSAGGRR